jgi:hypoxanthine phosphoribosyltransferase
MYRKFPNLPTEDELYGLALNLKSIIGDKKIVFSPIKWGGAIITDLLEPHLKYHGISYVRHDIQQAEEPRYDGYRPITTDPLELRSSNATALFVVDDETRTGVSLSSTYIWTLSNLERIGVECVLTIVYEDRLRIANFRCKPWPNPSSCIFRGRMKNYIARNFPHLYKDIKEKLRFNWHRIDKNFKAKIISCGTRLSIDFESLNQELLRTVG